jgi:short-subunit dehydrogenase
VQRVIFAENHSRPIKYLANAAGYLKPKPFLEHHHKDYDVYLDLNRAIVSFLRQSPRTWQKMAVGRS